MKSSKKRQAHAQEAWTNATKICRLTARQVEMARALGMNPRKLPRLRPSPQQRWKLPVGEFIEESYRKRFGRGRRDQHSRGGEPRAPKPSSADPDASAPERLRDPACQLSDLACYLVNLADDLQRWVVHGWIDPELLPEIREELQAIATALETGDPISPIPAIPVPPQPPRRGSSRHGRQERAFDDEDIPF
jgi:hypothetical protein